MYKRQTKAGAVTFHRFASLDEIDLLITDTDLDDESAAEFLSLIHI